ncbi:MAG: hypothetical protein A2V72_02275 [Candidatus Nealsonbacteria bacterium RBG_13_37_56]|uniref:Uncharacterized protein n=1 Tax=Candidatus Nealsonbacteria bacterium RBG_13_37_56 TaxID=1801661 RepID=A0A1G2DW17_9BACT|nr:MAG: hypothetical protein A2V72_02275 [Candidatus Nealsonbacteria bacterium RBG_13_37_56]
MDEKTREKFLKVYYNLPLKIREEVILDIEDKPITWNVAYVEIKNKTRVGEIILEKLTELEII